MLASFAHPDDEAFGVAGSFRKYCDEGVKTALICATRGEEGEISDPSLATPETLGEVREKELRTAARIMGVEDLTILDYRDGSFSQADEREATSRLVCEIRRLRPQVVITFDAQGGYGHPDHIAIHRLTVAAFKEAGDPARYPEQLENGLQPYAPQKLYVVAFSISVLRTVREAMTARGFDYRPGGNAATIPRDQIGASDERITTAIELTDEQFETKIRAMRAHRTQMQPNGTINQLPPEALRAWLGTERFILLEPPGAPGNAAEHDLFAGVHL
jgi:mycothiol S-conjugate amidase